MIKIFLSLIVGLPVALSASFFVAQPAQAQSTGGGVAVCFNPDNGDIKKPLNGDCGADGSYFKLEFDDGNIFSFFCIYEILTPAGNIWEPELANLSTDGAPSCSSAESPNPPPIIKGYQNLAVIGTNQTPPIINTPDPKNPGGTPPTPANPKPKTTPGNTPTGGDQTCEAGFKKVGPLCIPEGASGSSSTFAELAAKVIRVLLYFAGIIAVLFVILGGYQIMTAQGNETQATEGRKTLTNALIGLVVVIFSYAIVQSIISFVLKG